MASSWLGIVCLLGAGRTGRNCGRGRELAGLPYLVFLRNAAGSYRSSDDPYSSLGGRRLHHFAADFDVFIIQHSKHRSPVARTRSHLLAFIQRAEPVYVYSGDVGNGFRNMGAARGV